MNNKKISCKLGKIDMHENKTKKFRLTLFIFRVAVVSVYINNERKCGNTARYISGAYALMRMSNTV